MNLEKILENYGLTERQAKVYLACLEMGSASVQKISVTAGIPRSTVYEVLDFLRGKGFVSTFQKKRTKYFTAEDPQKIIIQAKGSVEMLEESLPRLRAVYKQAGTQPTVRFYQGKEGMKIILEEMLGEANELRSFASEDIFHLFGDWWTKYIQKRIKNKIPVRVIIPESSLAHQRQELGPEQLRTVKIIPKVYEHHGFVLVWKNKVAIFTFKKELMALVIESEEVASVQKSVFEFIWDGC